MPDGVTPSATDQNGKAVVSWSAQEIVPGVKMTAYVVTAHDTDPNPLPDVAHTVTASGADSESATFTAVELAGRKWKLGIIPKFRTWTGAEGKLSKDKVNFPAAAPTAPPVDPALPATRATTPAPETTPASPTADPTTSAPDKPAQPTKTKTPKPDPTPSSTPSDPTPSPSSSTSR